MTDEAVGCLYDIVQAYAQSDILDNPIRILGIDCIFDGLCAGFLEFLWRDLDQIFDGSL